MAFWQASVTMPIIPGAVEMALSSCYVRIQKAENVRSGRYGMPVGEQNVLTDIGKLDVSPLSLALRDWKSHKAKSSLEADGLRKLTVHGHVKNARPINLRFCDRLATCWGHKTAREAVQ